MHHTVVFNGKPVTAELGDTLFEAALSGAMLIPTDCSAGQCGCCRVRVVSGAVDAMGTAEDDTVLACQAKVSGQATIEFEPLPQPVKRSGAISGINNLSPEMIEVVVKLTAPLEFRPGQYVRAKFSGFPARDYSPTLRLDGTSGADELVFNIRRIPGGIVSDELGKTIAKGLAVSVQGPFGTAYLRDEDGPLVLVAGGSGWAPIWSLARAARLKQRSREIYVVAGSREAVNLYMRPSLDWLAADGATKVIATSEIGADGTIKSGFPTEHLPELGPNHTVYVAGPPGLVDAVKSRARTARARVFADPFVANGKPPSLMDRLTRTWNGLRDPGRRRGS